MKSGKLVKFLSRSVSNRQVFGHLGSLKRLCRPMYAFAWLVVGDEWDDIKKTISLKTLALCLDSLDVRLFYPNLQ